MSDSAGGTWTRYELHERPAGGDPWGVWSATGRWWHDRSDAEAACVRISAEYHARWPARACRLECAVVEVTSRVVRVFPPPEGGSDMARYVKLPCAREAEIQRAILATLKHLGVPCWRQNVGAFAVGSGASRRYFRAGEVGQSDLMGVLPGSGRLICVEVKRPGNRPTPHQIAFIQRINDVGGFAFWAEDVTTVNVVVKAVLDNPRLRVEVAEDGTMVLTDEEEERS